MIISQLLLKNWKNFHEIDVPLESRVFLIGPNASGKSNFLDALRFLRDVAEDGLDKAVAQRGGLSALRCLSARRDSDVALAVSLDRGAWFYRLKLKGKVQAGRQIPLVAEEFVQEGERILLNRPDAEDERDEQRLTQTALEQVNANKEFRAVADFLRSIVYRHIVPQAVRDPRAFSSAPVERDPFGRDFVLQLWNTPKNTRDARLRRMNEALKAVVPQLTDLSAIMDEKTGEAHLQAKYSHWRPQGAFQDQSQFSDGTLRLLALFWTLLEKGGPLLLEEPELSLHESIVRQLPGIFARLAQGSRNRRQIVLSTHSEALLADVGIQPEEVLRLVPGDEGTQVVLPGKDEIALFQKGLTAADVCLPKTNTHTQFEMSFPS